VANEIIPTSKSKHPIPALFEQLGVEKVTRHDKFSIEYAEGFLTATINREGGSVEVIRKRLKGGFTEVTSFDPSTMDRNARGEVIAKLRKDGFSQSEIARRIGFTQATVSNVLRKLNK
jgi:DNA-binding NarL/FixJ family response regulator